MFDAEDRELLAQAAVIVSAIIGTILTGALTLGIAVRIFELAAG